VTPENCTIEN